MIKEIEEQIDTPFSLLGQRNADEHPRQRPCLWERDQRVVQMVQAVPSGEADNTSTGGLLLRIGVMYFF